MNIMQELKLFPLLHVFFLSRFRLFYRVATIVRNDNNFMFISLSVSIFTLLVSFFFAPSFNVDAGVAVHDYNKNVGIPVNIWQ